jgi:NAD(P)-dependent dehydrogenase (short-subunit alcohol dehydrogenase family)
MLLEAVKGFGEGVFYEVNDVADLSQTLQLVDTITAKYGEIDILVNNAGINMKKPALEVTDIEFNNIIQTNLNAAFALSREVAKKMIPRKSGAIIMISSMTGYYGIDRVPAYTASKSGIEGLTKALASDWSKHNVRVHAIAPGFIETPMMQTAMNSDPDRMNKALNRTPMGKFGKPEDIGHAAVFLASEAASYITGVSLRVDGGNAIGF